MADLDPLAVKPPIAAEQLAVKPPEIDYWALQKINKEINSNPKLRDCEWFTHFKMQKLKEMGIDAEKLYVSTENGTGKEPNHVVAVVGDWVLDNRRPKPYTRAQMERGGYVPFPGYVIPVPPGKVP